MAILFIKSDLRLVIDLQTCVKAQQSRAYAQKVKISNLQQMARTIAYVQEHGYDSYEKLSETAEAIYTKMAKARGDAKLTESKLRKTNEQIHYLGQYLSTKSIYGEFLKAPNKKIFRQAHSDELAQYEEALQILKQHSPDGKFPTMKDLRAKKRAAYDSEGRPIRYLPLFQGLSQRTPDRVCQCRQHPRRRTRSAAARTAAHSEI